MTEVPVDFNVMARDGCGPRSMSRLTTDTSRRRWSRVRSDTLCESSAAFQPIPP